MAANHQGTSMTNQGTTTTSRQAITITDHMLPYDTHNTYTVTFHGTPISTTVTTCPSIVTTWLNSLLSQTQNPQKIIGLDVEWRPSYSRIQNPVATLQLSVSSQCLIFQLLHAPSIPQSLTTFLSNPNHTFVGIGVESDIERLQEDWDIGYRMRFVDLRGLAAERYGRRELKQGGIKVLAMEVLGKVVEKPKGVTMSRWDNAWLSEGQVKYACVDAYVSFEIGRVLNAGDAVVSVV